MKLVKVISPVALVLLLATLMLVTACGTQGPAGSQGEQGIQGEQGLPGSSMIVAMGTISANGMVLQGYNIANVTCSSLDYRITLSGITYNTLDYITIVTPMTVSHEFSLGISYGVIDCGYSSKDGKLVVRIRQEVTYSGILGGYSGTSSSYYYENPFSFVVLKVP